MAKFTDTYIKSLKPKRQPYKVYEKGPDAGFHVQVLKSGKPVFYLAYTFEGTKRFLKLGTYSSEFKLKEARTACRAARKDIDNTIDPQVKRQQEIIKQEAERTRLTREKQEKERATTINEILDLYIENVSPHTQTDATNLFSNKYCNVRKKIGKLPALIVTDEQIEGLIALHSDRGKLRTAGKLYAYMRAAFTRAKKHKPFMLKKWSNPFDSIDKPEGSNSNAIERTRNQEEIKIFLTLLESDNAIDPGIAAILEVILRTGQRVEQTSRIRWVDIDLNEGIWDVPAIETKVGKKTNVGHVVPLPLEVIEVITASPRIDEEWVFPGRAEGKPFSLGGISSSLKKLLKTAEHLPPFTPRDLRRTVTTHMSRLGILAEIRNRIQDHSIAGIEAKHYDRHDYLPEKRAALEKWERELQRIVGEHESEEGNVVQSLECLRNHQPPLQ